MFESVIARISEVVAQEGLKFVALVADPFQTKAYLVASAVAAKPAWREPNAARFGAEYPLGFRSMALAASPLPQECMGAKGRSREAGLA